MESGEPLIVRLHDIAHGRTGDKGNRLNVNVIAYHVDHWPLLLEQVTEDRVLDLFRHRGATRVRRYEVPNLMALNFVVDDVLEGGVNSSLSIDTHGKTLSYLVLSMSLRIPAGHGLSPGDRIHTSTDHVSGRKP